MSTKPNPVDPTTVEVAETPEVKLGKLASFRANHPRVSKALLITAGVVLAGGLGAAVASKSNKNSDSTPYDDGYDGTVAVLDSPSED